MLDLKLIRDEPERVRAELARRGDDATAGLDAVLELDGAAPRVDPAPGGAARVAQRGGRGDRRRPSAPARTRPRRSPRSARSARARRSSSRELAEIEERLQDALAPLPNLPDPTAAPGPEDELVKVVGSLAWPAMACATISNWPAR